MRRMNDKRWMWIGIACGAVLVVGGIWIVLSASRPGLVPASDSTEVATGASIPTSTATSAAMSTRVVALTLTTPSQPLDFDADLAYLRILEQCGFGARPTGSMSNRLLGDYVRATVAAYGWSVEVQEFVYRKVAGRNIIARKGKGPVVILGAHYDTRPYADYDPPETRNQHILGANDGGSGVAVLLELARVLDMDKVPYEVRLAFFDAEDRGNLDGWPFSVGAEEYAKVLEVDPKYVIVVDMVGDESQTIYWDRNSDPELNARIWDVAAELGYARYFIPELRWRMIDDHLPFAKRGWKAIDIIDFDYPHWHTTQDTADKVSAESLGRVGRVIEVFLEGPGG